MSTSLLYHAFGLRGYKYLSTRYETGKTIFVVTEDPDHIMCSRCHSKRIWVRGHNKVRRFRNVNIGCRLTDIELAPARVQCLDCGSVQQAKIGFANPMEAHTHMFERYAYDLCRMTTLTRVARHLGVSWGTIKGIEKKFLQTRFGHPRLKDLRYIAIDEICIGRPYRFLTVVLDCESGCVVHAVKGKSEDSLKEFWRRLKISGAKVEAVAIDMSPAYKNAVQNNLSNAVIVNDPFHVIKLMNQKITTLRQQIQREADEKLKMVLKGTRWLLLKNPENLDETRDERTRLDLVLRINAPLATVYYLKEDLRMFWRQGSKKEARKYLKGWLGRAEASGIPIMKNLAKTLAAHRSGLLAYYDYPITTGQLEGTNNKIKTLQRQSYGFRDMEYFKLKLYAIHEAQYQLIG